MLMLSNTVNLTYFTVSLYIHIFLRINAVVSSNTNLLRKCFDDTQ